MALQQFDSKFEELLESIYADLPEGLKEVVNYLKTAVRYNVPHGKKNRGLTVFRAVQLLSAKGKKAQDGEKLAHWAIATGWAIEWLQASFLVHDDIMDQSETRRGQICWYLESPKVAAAATDRHHPSMNLLAVNDGIHLLLSSLQLLRLHCSTAECYHELVQLFLDATHRTSLGQAVDCLTPICDHTSRYSEQRYKVLVQWKTAYYSFYLPVMAAILLSGYKCDDTQRKTVESILMSVGEYFQTQDDFLDVFGDPAVTGKVGMDIVDGKCAWPIVKAMELANESQRAELWRHYGKDDETSTSTVRRIFDELALPALYEMFEAKSYAAVRMEIEHSHVPSEVKEVLYFVINSIYKREK